MYTSTTTDINEAIHAWRLEDERTHIWFGHHGHNTSVSRVNYAEARQLIAELQRELADADDADHAAMMRDSVRQADKAEVAA